MKLTGQSGTLSVNGIRSRSFGVSGEYQFTDRLGVDLGAFRASPDVNLLNRIKELDLDARATDGQAMAPVMLGLNVHLMPEDRLDVYVAPFIAYIFYGDLEFYINETIEIDGQPITLQDSVRVDVADDWGYGATLGIDVPFSSRPWAFAANARYLVTNLDITDPEGDREDLGFDSWVISLGVRYTF